MYIKLPECVSFFIVLSDDLSPPRCYKEEEGKKECGKEVREEEEECGEEV